MKGSRPCFLRLLCCAALFLAHTDGSVAQEQGIASYYHDKFHGRKTAGGGRYDRNRLVAAHRTLAFGTYVRVTDLSNGKHVVVRIEDRGPFRKKRVIDLSYEAARRLDLLVRGTARVRLEEVPVAADLSDWVCLRRPVYGIRQADLKSGFVWRAPGRVVLPEKKKRCFFSFFRRRAE